VIPSTSHIRILHEMLMQQFQEMGTAKVNVIVEDDG
jgi:hypothetical protein